MRLNLRVVLILCAAVFMPLAANAGNCSCTGATLNVGAFSVFAGGGSSPTATVAITCNGNASYNLAISTGNSGTYASRRMDQVAGDSMTYNIYTDAARTSVWATIAARTYTVSTTEPLYLKIDPAQDIRYSGNIYQDSVVITMTPDGATGGPTRTCNVTFQATVLAECVAPNAALAFGAYDPVSINSTAGSPLDATTNLLYNCTKGVSATIGLDNGSYFSGSRRMSGPSANFLNYDIFTNSARSTRWTAIAGGMLSATSTSKNTPLGGATGIPAYGRVPGAQDIVGGAYSDSVTATVNY